MTKFLSIFGRVQNICDVYRVARTKTDADGSVDVRWAAEEAEVATKI